MLPALSVKQPWASWIATGDKTIETRTWSTDYRGPLLIVASQGVDGRLERRALDSNDAALLERIRTAPRGMALCVVNLLDCRPMTADDEAAAGCAWRLDLWAWCFQGLWPLAPYRVRGRLGLYRTAIEPEAFGDRDIYDEVRRLAVAAGATHAERSAGL